MQEVPKEQSQPQVAAVPPYVPFRTFRNFIEGLKQGIPSRIDRSVMGSMSGGLQSQLAAALKSLSLISANGLPTELLPKLVNSEGADRIKTWRQILALGYPFLFKNFDLKSATPRMVAEEFSKAGASGGTIDKCILFFLAAAKEAGIEVSPHLKSIKAARGASRPRRSQQQEQNGATPVAVIQPAQPESALTWEQMLLSKFPSFDPAWPDNVKAEWFAAFNELMKRGQVKQ